MTVCGLLVVFALVPCAARALDVSAGAVEVTGSTNVGLSLSSSTTSRGSSRGRSLTPATGTTLRRCFELGAKTPR
jgi:hypothetical protein